MTETPTCRTCRYWNGVFTASGNEIVVCTNGRPSNWVKTQSDYSCHAHKPRGEHPQFKEKVNE